MSQRCVFKKEIRSGYRPFNDSRGEVAVGAEVLFDRDKCTFVSRNMLRLPDSWPRRGPKNVAIEHTELVGVREDY